MQPAGIAVSYDPNRFIDTVLSWLDVQSDLELSDQLRVSPTVIQDLRRGRLAIWPSFLLWISECSGRSMAEIRHALGDRRSKARLSCVNQGLESL